MFDVIECLVRDLSVLLKFIHVTYFFDSKILIINSDMFSKEILLSVANIIEQKKYIITHKNN